MLKRLEELNRRTQPSSLKDRDHGEVVADPDSKLVEVVATPPGGHRRTPL
jgi:hypothetical protein